MSDLKVMREGKKIRLQGHLEDTTQIDLYRSDFQGAGTIDMSGLASISFVGMQRLIGFLRDLGGDPCFCEVPSDVYRIMLLFPEVGQSLGVESFYVDVCQQGKKDLVPRRVELEQLFQMGQQQGTFARFDDGAMIVGSLSHLCRPHFGWGSITSQFANPWCRQHSDLCQFWYDYASFCEINIQSCAFVQKATLFLVMEMLNRIVPQIQKFNRAFSQVLPADPRYDFKRHANLYNDMFVFSDENFAKIFEQSQKFSKVQIQLLELFSNPFASETQFRRIIQTLLETAQSLGPLALNMDQVGSQIGDRVHSLSYIFDWGKELNNITASPEQKTIDSLVRRLGLDCKGAPWNETLNAVNLQFQTLQGEFDRCVLQVQQFDLIKQVFEHRIREADLVFPNVSNASLSINWDESKSSLLTKAAEKLVTDLEKLSFEFFFPSHIHQAADNSLNAGQLLMF